MNLRQKPPRTPRELPLLPNSATFAHLFRPKPLELILRDVDAKAYLDIELVYRLRQKESRGSVKQKIIKKIQQNEPAFCFEDLVRELLEAV